MSIEVRDYSNDLVQQYEHWAVYLHENQSYLGRTYVALTREGEIDPFVDTTEDERSELLVVVSGLKKCLSELYQPDLLNYANLRNTWHHCHWHIIPRYQTQREVEGQLFIDENWGKNYAPYNTGFQISSDVFGKIKGDISAKLADAI